MTSQLSFTSLSVSSHFPSSPQEVRQSSGLFLSQTQILLTKICQVCNEIRDIKWDTQSHHPNNKYVYSVNKEHTRGVHIINKINTPRQTEDNIINNHKVGKEDIYVRGHKDYNYSSDKSPTCQKGVGSNAYNHDDCEEPPIQMLSCLTPERPKSFHDLSPDPLELTGDTLVLPPSSPALFQSSSLSDLSPFCPSSEFPETSSRGGMRDDIRLGV
jgi:hypothetical protein